MGLAEGMTQYCVLYKTGKPFREDIEGTAKWTSKQWVTLTKES